MFEIAKANDDGDNEEIIIDVYEPSTDIQLLIRLLHDDIPVYPKKSYSETSIDPSIPAIPLPILLQLFDLGDKYVLSEHNMNTLYSHLSAYAATNPLLVYGRAVKYGLSDIADTASVYLMATRLDTLTPAQVRVIPSAEAYHKIVLLQQYRKTKITELLMNSELFPYGYGKCSAHFNLAITKWETERAALCKLVEAGTLNVFLSNPTVFSEKSTSLDTDVSAEMSSRLEELSQRCTTCRKAICAATDMLAVSQNALYDSDTDDE